VKVPVTDILFEIIPDGNAEFRGRCRQLTGILQDTVNRFLSSGRSMSAVRVPTSARVPHESARATSPTMTGKLLLMAQSFVDEH
jgi:hypothetical protein